MYRKINRAILIVLPAIVSLSCNNAVKSQSNTLAGYYISKIPTYGYLENTIRLELHTNFTFKLYWSRYSGEYTGMGTYKVVNDTIVLNYAPTKYDTTYDNHDSAYYTKGKDTLKYNSKAGNLVMDVKHPVAPTIDIDTSGATQHIVHIHRYSLSYCINERPKKYYFRNKKLQDVESKSYLIRDTDRDKSIEE
jgi:hypothetical protein